MRAHSTEGPADPGPRSPRPRGPRRLGSVKLWALVSAAAIVAVYLASITWAGPWDPWETHYGEVARQILVRQDPLDLWWKPGNGGPQGNAENTFWSKPPLLFWALAVSLAAFRVGTGPDPAELVTGPWTELALRVPSVLVGLGAAAFLGYVLWRLVSPRAGLLAAWVLATMPQWAMVSRQALTDVFYAGPVVVALGAWVLAWWGRDRPLTRRKLGRVSIPWDPLMTGYWIALLVLAVAPLAAIHLFAVSPYTAARVSRFAKRAGVPNLETLRAIALHMWIYWALLLALVVRAARWTRAREVWLGLMYLMAGAACMAKGLIGPGLVGAVVLADLVVCGRWRRLREAGLPFGVVAVVLVVFPWHHAMWLYRGERWVNEWIVVNNLARFGSGEQKHAVGDFAYYLEVLGVAALPWVALVPLALGRAVRAFAAPDRAAPREPVGDRRRAAMRFFALAFAVCLWAITFSATKYYHYLVPVLPPAAALVAILLDDAWRREIAGSVRWLGVLAGATLLALAVRDVLAEPALFAHLTTYLYTGMWRKGAPETTRVLWASLPLALGLVLWLAGRMREGVVSMALGGLLTTAYVIDDYVPAASESWSQRSAFRVYFRDRAPNDRAISWWFYYRGETFFTKGDIWVMKEADRTKLAEYIDTVAAKHPDAALWFVTTVGHGGRLTSHLPTRLRRHAEKVYENFHYVLYRVPVTPPGP